MAKKDHVLVRRARAAQTTLDRFKGRPFKFGRFDCGKMVAFHLRAIGNPIKAAARVGPYSSFLGATKALKKLGHADLVAMADSHLPRIPPAAAIVGDIVAMPGLEGPGALTVAMGNGRVLGYHEDAEGAVVMHPLEMVAAWRALPA